MFIASVTQMPPLKLNPSYTNVSVSYLAKLNLYSHDFCTRVNELYE